MLVLLSKFFPFQFNFHSSKFLVQYSKITFFSQFSPFSKFFIEINKVSYFWIFKNLKKSGHFFKKKNRLFSVYMTNQFRKFSPIFNFRNFSFSFHFILDYQNQFSIKLKKKKTLQFFAVKKSRKFWKNYRKKLSKKLSEKNQEYFSAEIFHLMGRLHIQNFIIF